MMILYRNKKIIYTLFLLFAIHFIFCQEIKPKNLRDLSPDRPHQTESPITVDKWHVMVESDILNFTKKKIMNDELSSLGIGAANLKFGFHKRMDIEIISGVYSKNSYKNYPSGNSHTNFSDFTFRYKYNIVGNDSGSFALAIMPLVRTTNFFNQKLQVLNGGLLINAEKELHNGIGIGYTGGLSSFSCNPFMKMYELFSTISLDYKVAGALHHFVELSYRYNKSADFLHTYSFDSGFTFTPTLNLQFDAGFYFFLPAKSPFLFIGGTIRI